MGKKRDPNLSEDLFFFLEITCHHSNRTNLCKFGQNFTFIWAKYLQFWAILAILLSTFALIQTSLGNITLEQILRGNTNKCLLLFIFYYTATNASYNMCIFTYMETLKESLFYKLHVNVLNILIWGTTIL